MKNFLGEFKLILHTYQLARIDQFSQIESLQSERENNPMKLSDEKDQAERGDNPFFLRLIWDRNIRYYPVAGDLVLQQFLPKFDPHSNDLTPMGSWPVLVVFSDHGQCISLPLWESPSPPQHVP